MYAYIYTYESQEYAAVHTFAGAHGPTCDVKTSLQLRLVCCNENNYDQ